MMQELIQWLDAQNIEYTTIDNEVIEIPNFGKMFLADLSGVESIFKSKDGDVRFNLMENPQDGTIRQSQSGCCCNLRKENL